MYAKYIVFFFLLGLLTLLPAQSADQNRINIRIFPSQVLSITTAKDLKHSNQYNYSSQKQNRNELRASNLYGYQIKLLNENKLLQTNTSQSKQNKNQNNCPSDSKLIYSKTSSGTDHKIPTQYPIYSQREIINKCTISETDRMLVYVIITQ